MTETEKLARLAEYHEGRRDFLISKCADDDYAQLEAGTHDDLAKIARQALTAWNTRPAPALNREEVKAALQSSRGWPADLHPGPAADAILSMVGGGVPAEPTQPAYRYQDDSAVNSSMLSVSSTVEG